MSQPFSKSFILTTTDDEASDASYAAAVTWLDHSEAMDTDGSVLSAMSAASGQGIESTSFLLTAYNSLMTQVRKLLVLMSVHPPDNVDPTKKDPQRRERTVVHLAPDSQIWSALHSNSTLFAHALVIRTAGLQNNPWPPLSHENAVTAIQQASRSHSLLLGQVNMIKFDAPHHIGIPKRLLARDLVYVWNKFVMRRPTTTTTTTTTAEEETPPWNMAHAKPDEFARYEAAQKMKQQGSGYPYWKPESSHQARQ